MANKNDILLVCHSNKCADEKEKREYYCSSVPVYGYIISSGIHSVARAISISGLRDRIAILPVVDRCQNHHGTLSLNSPWSKTPELPFKF